MKSRYFSKIGYTTYMGVFDHADNKSIFNIKILPWLGR